MGKRILLVEDEPNILEAIRFILSRDGWTVATHSDGASAVAAVLRAAPDVLMLDVMLPGRSGFEVLRELRASPETAALPVLMLTAKGQDRDRDLAERAGATRFMSKPFSNSEVLEAVNALGAAAAERDARGPDARGPDARGPDARGPDAQGPGMQGPGMQGPAGAGLRDG